MKNLSHTEAQQEPIVVFGYGAQGRAHALNLRDSGHNVKIFLRAQSDRMNAARESGLPVLTDPVEAVNEARIAAIMIPDGDQPQFYTQYLEPHLPEGAALVFAHGFALHYRQILPRPDLDTILVAPLAQGETVRSDYLKGGGVPIIVAIEQDATGLAHTRGHAYAKGISKVGPFIDTSIAEEVETDLFAEQAVLCGGLPELIRASFETLVERGYNPDIAYFSCLREVRAIVRLLDGMGIVGMRDHISDTARFGAITRGPRVIDGHTRDNLAAILDDIRSGAFTKELILERHKGHPTTNEALSREQDHAIERIHRKFNPPDRES